MSAAPAHGPTPTPTPTPKTLQTSLLGWVKEFLTSLAADFAHSALKGKIGEMFEAKVIKDDRGELFEDFRQLHNNQKDNLLRRHQEAKEKNLENRFVSLLLKIPKDATTGNRVVVLMYLNSLPDQEFWQMLDLLEHDVIPQAFRRTTQSIAEESGKLATWLESLPGGKPRNNR